jgi:hypothetical protein
MATKVSACGTGSKKRIAREEQGIHTPTMEENRAKRRRRIMLFTPNPATVMHRRDP